MSEKSDPEKVVREIERTRRKFSTEELTRIVLEGQCGAQSVADALQCTGGEAHS
jgi:hypothetical protein